MSSNLVVSKGHSEVAGFFEQTVFFFFVRTLRIQVLTLRSQNMTRLCFETSEYDGMLKRYFLDVNDLK